MRRRGFMPKIVCLHSVLPAAVATGGQASQGHHDENLMPSIKCAGDTFRLRGGWVLEQMRDLSAIITEGVIKNPIVWILAGLLVLAECGSHLRWRELVHICELLGKHDAHEHPVTPKEEIDNICASETGDAF